MSFWGTLGQGLMLIAPFTGPFAITLYVAGASLAYADQREETRRSRNQARDAYNASLRDRMQMVDLQADAPRTLVLGRVRAVEGIRRRWVSGTNSEKLTLIVSYAGHQIDAFESWYVDDMPVTLDGSGYVQEEPYRKVRSGTYAQDVSLVNGSGTFSLTYTYVAGSVSAVYSTGSDTVGLTVTENGGASISLSGGPGSSTVTATITYQFVETTNRLRIRPYLGTSTQNVGSDLAAEYPAELTATDEFQGIALAVVDLLYDPDAFTQGIPNITAVMRGAKIYDPRLDSTVSGGSGAHRENNPATWAWSENPALIAHHYARHANGWAVPAAEIETADVMAAATQCDISTSFTLRMPDNSTENVVLPRHRCGIVIPTDSDPRSSMGDIMASMGGRWGWAGGTLRMRAAKMGTSAFTLDSSWIAQRLDEQGNPQSGAVVRWSSGVPRQDKLNRVTGRCVDPSERYQVLAFPSVADSTLIAAEGEYAVDVTYAGVNHVAHAQHLASIAIRESQASLRGELACNVSAWPVELFDVGSVTLSRYGMSAKTFECIGWRWHPTEGVMLRLAEITADMFTVAAELTGRDPAPNSNLPAPWDVETIGGVAVTSGTVALTDGSVITRTLVTWTAATSASIRSGGQIEVQYWPANEALPASGEWISTFEQGSAAQTVINGLKGGTAYLFRVRAVQLVPYVRGNWSVLKQHVVAQPPTPLLWRLDLSPWALLLPADESGNVYSFAEAVTTCKVWRGTTDDSLGWTFSRTNGSGVTSTITQPVLSPPSNAQLSITALSVNSGYVDVTATQNGGTGRTITQRIIVTKAIKGQTGATGGTGATGTPGKQYASPTVYQWAATIPSGPTGAATYTWATGAFGSAPSPWTLTPGTSPSVGFTLWGAAVALIADATDATTNFNWTSAVITARGAAGSNGAQGEQGGSARIAYAKTTATSLNATPTTYTTSGSTSFPPTNTWGGSEVWQGTVPSYSAGENVYQTNGVYNPVTNETVWGVPYLSALKVGSLSAITANLGTVTAGTISGLTITGGLIQTAASGQRITLNESSSNEVRIYGDVGGGVEQVAQIGPHYNSGLSTHVFAEFGSLTAGAYMTGVLGKSTSGYGVYGITSTGRGVFAESTGSGDGVYATTGSGRAVHAYGGSGDGIYASAGSGGRAIYAPGSVAITDGNATSDPYGRVSITLGTASSYTYLGLTRSGSTVYGIGITTGNEWWLGTPTSGHSSTLSGTPHIKVNTSGDVTINGKFGCNTKSAQAAYSVGAALPTDGSASNADIATRINQLRTALINCGICV